MKIALFGTNQLQFSKVYTPEVMKKLGEYGELSEKINRKNLKENGFFAFEIGYMQGESIKKIANECGYFTEIHCIILHHQHLCNVGTVFIPIFKIAGYN